MTSRFRVLLTDRAWPDAKIETAILRDANADLIEASTTDEATLVRMAADVDAIVTNWGRVTEAVIRNSPRCRIVSRTGIGIDNIAVATATELGIPVTNCPEYCVSEVSDHALGLLLACARRIAFFHGRTKRAEYNLVQPQRCGDFQNKRSDWSGWATLHERSCQSCALWG